jgi:AcrR family transcriptional regulator
LRHNEQPHRDAESPGAASPGPGRPRSEQAHRAILDATLELLAKVGYDRLTVAGVAARAGVGKATIYRRWPSKLPLVVDAFLQLPELESPDTGNVVDDLAEVLRRFVEIIDTTPLASVLPVLAGERARDPELAQTLAPVFRARRAPLIDVLERAVARRELPPDIDLEAAADVIMGPIVTRLFFTGADLDPANVRPFVDAALFGINRLRS